jgi:CheY-like chemotaxis protein
VAHILLIDDDDSVRRSLAKILERAEHRVTAAADGAEGLRALQEDRPDLIITDVYMPEMDGIEILIRIRDADPELPVVVISGGGFAPADFVLEDASQLGADAILSKPFERSVVLDTVRRALKARG